MSKIIFSRLLNLFVILTFFFPFFYDGCAESSQKEAETKQNSDSINAININGRTITGTVDLNNTDTLKEPIDKPGRKSTIESQNDDESTCQSLVKKYPFLSIVLMPSKYTYSGIGAIVNVSPMFYYFSIFISFLLLFIGLLIKFIDPNSTRTFIILDILILVGIAVSRNMSFSFERLWGYWACILMSSFLLIFDIFFHKTEKH
jgi:hypothetical protein